MYSSSLQQNSERRMETIRALKEHYTPETITAYWRTRFEIEGARAGVDIAVPECDWTHGEIARPMVRIGGRELEGRMIYLPKELTDKPGLVLLGRMYPGLKGEKSEESYTLEKDTQVTNVHDTYGWIKVEATGVAPNRDTTEEQLRTFADEQGYLMQREVVYVLASLASKDSTGKFFDEGGRTWSRLGGSRGEGGSIAACFYTDGHLRVLLAVDPMERNLRYGGRFEEFKKPSRLHLSLH